MFNMLFIGETMKSYECKIFMGSIRQGSEGTQFSETSLIREIRKFQYLNLDIKITLRLTATKFVFLYYEEPGFEIAAIQYPRFPLSEGQIWQWMNKLGKHLKKHFEQKSLSIMDSDTINYLGEPDDNPVT